MSGQRLALVLLVVVSVLFAVSVGLGVGREGPAGEPGWVTLVRDTFVRERPIQPRDVTGPCVSGGRTVVIPMGSPCTVTIGSRQGALIRKMFLELAIGRKVEGSLRPGGDTAGPVTITLQSRVRTLKLPIVEEGAAMDLTCVEPMLPTPACTVTIR